MVFARTHDLVAASWPYIGSESEVILFEFIDKFPVGIAIEFNAVVFK